MNTSYFPHRLITPTFRLLFSLGMASTVLFFLPDASPIAHWLSAWDAGIVCFLVLVWGMILRSDADQTREQAQHQEINHRAIFLSVLFIAFVSLFVIAAILSKNKDSLTLEVGLSIVAIVCSWLLVQTMFTLHYAAFYYRLPQTAAAPDDNPDTPAYSGGLAFSSDDPPRYLDFVYFTFTLGMTSQTSDTMLVSPAMRRLALGHTVLSFYFYSVILALSVSIVAGLL